MTPDPRLDRDWAPRWRRAWRRFLGLARHPLFWALAAAGLLLAAGLAGAILQARPGCAWHHTHAGRPAVICARHHP